MNLENIAKNIKKGIAVLSLVSALSFGTAQAQPVEKHFLNAIIGKIFTKTIAFIILKDIME